MKPSTLKLTWPALRRKLAAWYAKAKRDLPWRRTSDPYAITVSEVMLQQTQVVTVIPYYERWLKLFPTWQALASAKKQEVIKAWEGLGYYHRARNLHALAKVVVRAGGELPRTEEALRALPGIGPYTAAAVGSIAFGLPLAVLDGNVMRVLARLAGPVGRYFPAANTGQIAGDGRTTSSTAEIPRPTTRRSWNWARRSACRGNRSA